VSERRAGDRLFIDVGTPDALAGVLSKLLEAGARIESVLPRRESLEEYFLREVSADAGVQEAAS